MRTTLAPSFAVSAALSIASLCGVLDPAAAADTAPAPASAAAATTGSQRTPSPAGAEAYLIAPADGARVKSPVVVRFGLKGMGVAPAGVKFENTGHFHLYVDTELPTDLSMPLPASDKTIHYGKGQTEASLALSPGKHTLQLILGDQNHVPHNPPVISKQITITVIK